MKKSEKSNVNSLKRSVLSTLAFGLFAFFALFVLWGVAYIAVGNPYLVPSIGKTFRALGEVLREPMFYAAFADTLLRVLKAFLLSIFPALLLSVGAYLSMPLRKITAVFVSALRSLPVMAVLLMILVWSTPKSAPVIVAFLSLFPSLYTGFLASLFSIKDEYKRVCKLYKVPIFKQVFQMYLPQIAPQSLRESAGALSFSVKLVVSAEVVASTYISLGGEIQSAKIYSDMPRMLALTLIVVFTGLLLETLGNIIALAVERRVK